MDRTWSYNSRIGHHEMLYWEKLGKDDSAGTGAEFAHRNDVVKAHTMDFRVSVSYPAKWSEDWLRIGQISCEHGEGVSHVQMSNFRAGRIGESKWDGRLMYKRSPAAPSAACPCCPWLHSQVFQCNLILQEMAFQDQPPRISSFGACAQISSL